MTRPNLSGVDAGSEDPAVIAIDSLGGWEPLTVAEVTEMFRSAPFPWWIVGGWAIDLFLGHETRPHDDIEIAVLRRDQIALREWLRGWQLWFVPGPGAGLARWREGTDLAADVHEIWCRTESSPWRLEILIEEAEADRWKYRRDTRISAPLELLGQDVDGIRVIRPEIALLYESKGTRERDRSDFEAALPRLDAPARRWLLEALERAGTGAEWLDALRLASETTPGHRRRASYDSKDSPHQSE